MKELGSKIIKGDEETSQIHPHGKTLLQDKNMHAFLHKEEKKHVFFYLINLFTKAILLLHWSLIKSLGNYDNLKLSCSNSYMSKYSFIRILQKKNFFRVYI